MNNTHGYISTTSCACWDIDSLNRAGIAETDIDNGVFVVCSAPAVESTSKEITGYHFPVTLASATSKHVWVVNTPEVGSTIEMQMMSDPRYFYNEAGKGLSLKYLLPHVDCIEVDAHCFANNTLPTTAQGFVTIGANGKLVAGNSAPGTAGQPYFSVLGFKDVAVGMDMMKVAVLQCEEN